MEITPSSPSPSAVASAAGLDVRPGQIGAAPASPQPLQFSQASAQTFSQPGVLRIQNVGALRVEFDRIDGPCVLMVLDPVRVIVRVAETFRSREPGPTYPEDIAKWRAILEDPECARMAPAGGQRLNDTEVDAVVAQLFEWHARVGKASAPPQT